MPELNSWDDFEKVISDSGSDLLFRGQANAEWELKTTLDRIKNDMFCSEYNKVILKMYLPVKSYIGVSYSLKEYVDPKTDFPWNFKPTNLEFMIYLRHHQFPSPLLDWTRSPYIAAFFAFNSENIEESVAIFSYKETITESKSWTPSSPTIFTVSKNVVTHRRHHIQQSDYTVSLQNVGAQLHYVKHPITCINGDTQDIVTKYVLPKSLKKQFLSKLDSMNINEYTLFLTDESLMHALSNREFIFQEELT